MSGTLTGMAMLATRQVSAAPPLVALPLLMAHRGIRPPARARTCCPGPCHPARIIVVAAGAFVISTAPEHYTSAGGKRVRAHLR
ncbi:hypothetical protein [Komagataeibacter sp. FNDCF1]|uniref:hypothetical protein n=1 Tax=Komagataeibacter sp. FNDCF1 TaxID=2878681 RepID=UPI001E367B5B|nr:hypothetical protein [Komagataeibacter sp. FNDCF1]MCE2563736.1 hypothetical protein [Komagataeibacter sp. FNDCF1]